MSNEKKPPPPDELSAEAPIDLNWGDASRRVADEMAAAYGFKRVGDYSYLAGLPGLPSTPSAPSTK